MSIARRQTIRIAVALVLLGHAVSSVDRRRFAFASSPGSLLFPVPGPSGGAPVAVTVALAAGLMVLLALGAWWFTQYARYRRQQAKLIREAGASASGCPQAIAVIAVPGLGRLSAAKSRGAMECLRLYLEGALEPGECAFRIRRYEYGLCLCFRDSAAFERRLEVLKQDVSFLYMASYPGLNVAVRAARCTLDGTQGALDALRRARGQAQTEHGE